MNFFEINKENQLNINKPLAAKLRPEKLEDFIGQEHILGEGMPLSKMILSDKIISMIFYGPTGVGKTTVAKIIANTTNMCFFEISATNSGIKDIRDVIESAEENLSINSKKSILFIDEIHRFNKSQQDTLLPYVENGLLTLIGATTENPFFEVNKALISRCKVITFEKLNFENSKKMLLNALSNKERGYGNFDIEIDDQAIEYLINTSSGDGRVLLNSLEVTILFAEKKDEKIHIKFDDLKNSLLSGASYYDKTSTEHYDTISSFIKSMRGSDVDAAIYYLAKMIVSGEDLKFICRRIAIFAAEDIGMADPNALNIANSTMNLVQMVGNPESRIILSNAVIYMCLAPKSNSAYLAINKAVDFVKNNNNINIPSYLRENDLLNTNIRYKYPHNYLNHWVDQDYLPDKIKNIKFYNSGKIGYEKRINERLEIIKNGGNDGSKKTF